MDLSFPHLGIEIEKLNNYFDLFGFKLMFYGLIIGLGMVVGVSLILRLANKEGLGEDLFMNLALIIIPLGIIGARLYYVIFSWDYYGSHPAEIFNIRGGGLAIYGGILTGIVVAYVYSRIKKVPFAHIADLAIIAVAIGQIMGRWGNFFNCEAFGGYTDNLLAMRINRALVNPSMISAELDAAMQANLPEIAADYIQVHPTFLYESLGNCLVLAIMLIYRPKRKFRGGLFYTYLTGYGIVRFLVEGLRTDQLKLWNTDFAVSQLLSVLLIIIGVTMLIRGNIMVKKNPEKALVLPVSYMEDQKKKQEA